MRHPMVKDWDKSDLYPRWLLPWRWFARQLSRMLKWPRCPHCESRNTYRHPGAGGVSGRKCRDCSCWHRRDPWDNDD